MNAVSRAVTLGVAAAPLALASPGRRITAKLIDFVFCAISTYGFSKLLGPTAGVLIAWGWLFLSDWSGSVGKSWLGLEVRSVDSGAPCTPLQSISRNLPLLWPGFLQRMHMALLDMDRITYRAERPTLVLAFGLFTLGFAALELVLLFTRRDSTRWGDQRARTVVVQKVKSGS